jgi:hypothetical protein
MIHAGLFADDRWWAAIANPRAAVVARDGTSDE